MQGKFMSSLYEEEVIQDQSPGSSKGDYFKPD